MPQLDPSPWMLIYILTWLVLLNLILPKVVNQEFLNNAQPKTTMKSKKQPWNW